MHDICNKIITYIIVMAIQSYDIEKVIEGSEIDNVR